MLLGEQRPPQPIDWPLPIMQIGVFSSRLTRTPSGDWALRYQPLTLIGPGQWGPQADHHVELLFQEQTLVATVEQIGLHASSEFKARLRAALADVDVPPKLNAT